MARPPRPPTAPPPPQQPGQEPPLLPPSQRQQLAPHPSQSSESESRSPAAAAAPSPQQSPPPTTPNHGPTKTKRPKRTLPPRRPSDYLVQMQPPRTGGAVGLDVPLPFHVLGAMYVAGQLEVAELELRAAVLRLADVGGEVLPLRSLEVQSRRLGRLVRGMGRSVRRREGWIAEHGGAFGPRKDEGGGNEEEWEDEEDQGGEDEGDGVEGGGGGGMGTTLDDDDDDDGVSEALWRAVLGSLEMAVGGGF